ncbi:MAG: hypothetical protein AAFU85_24180 [Planctomycetota bacterium]
MFKDRANKIDLLLMFAATFAITVAFWPRNAPLQVVKCLDKNATWQTYSIAIDDPALDTLRHRLDQWKRPELDPAYAAAKWRKELAERYRDEAAPSQQADSVPPIPAEPIVQAAPTTARLSDTVTFASYEQEISQASEAGAVQLASLESESEPPAVSSPSDRDYWEQVSREAEAEMRAAEEARAEPPIVFGARLPAMLPERAFHAAFLFGILAACVYMHWLVQSPYKANSSLRRQPLAVIARLAVFASTILFAFVSSAVIWL